MAVISIFTARMIPITKPTTIPPTISARPSVPPISWWNMVATTATSMPTAPRRFPRTAVRGWVRPFSPRMNNTPATT